MSPPARLSLAMVAKDHVKTIGRAIESAATICDEMVVVDAESTDRTAEIAQSLGARVDAIKWTNDFAAARNESFARCTGDWILWLNADDVVPAKSQHEFIALKEVLADDIDVIVAPYHDRIADDGTPMFTFHRERLVRRAAGLRWEGRVHERISVPSDRLGLTADLIVEHRPDPDRLIRDADRALAILADMVASGDRSARTHLHYANELFDHGRFGEAADMYGNYLAAEPEGADRYWANVFLAESLLVLEDPDGARAAALDALRDDSGRGEAFVVLGRIHFEAEEWEEAVPLFTAATVATRPRLGLVRHADYSYLPWDYLSVCYEKLGQLPAALAAAQHSLAGNPQADRIRANMHWIVDHL